MLDHWDDTVKFILNHVSPTLGISSGIFWSVGDLFKSAKGKEEKAEEEEKKCVEAFGMAGDVKREFEKVTMKFAFEENMKGANDEARLCLRSTEGCDWLACEDYPEYVKALKGTWERRVDAEGGAKLRVRVILPETDAMIGEKGKKYFQECWTRENCGKGIDVVYYMVNGADHDSVINPENEVLGIVFSAAQGE